MGIFAGKPRKAFDHPGVYDTEDFVRQCFVPTEGIVCTRQNKGYFHSRTMDYMGAPPGDDEAIQLCSYIIHDCTVQDKQCNLNISAKGLEVSLLGCLIFPPEDKLQPQVSKNSLRGPKKPKVKVDPLQQRIQAAEADETRQQGTRRRIDFTASPARPLCEFNKQIQTLQRVPAHEHRTMPPDGADRRLSVLAAILSVLTVALASVGGYEGYIFFVERSTYQNQALGLCFDGRRGGESLDDAKFTVRPGPWSLRQNQRGPPDPQLLCDIPVYAYECPQWANSADCSRLHSEELREVALLRTTGSGVFCFGSLGWFSWDQEACDADIWTCTFGSCSGYKKSERVCAATLSESYVCYFDPTRPGVGERETPFDYPLLRGVAMAALSVLTLAAGISACYFGATRVVPLLCSFGWTPLIVLATIVMSAGIGFMMEAAMIVLLPGVTPYSLVGGPRFPEVRQVTVADLGGA
eukprot:s2810_g1.t1